MDRGDACKILADYKVFRSRGNTIKDTTVHECDWTNEITSCFALPKI